MAMSETSTYGATLPGGESGDHQLRHPDRERAHARRDDRACRHRRQFRSPPRCLCARCDEPLKCLAHAGDGAAAVGGGKHGRRAMRMECGDFAGLDVDRRLRRRDPDVDDERLAAGGAHPLGRGRRAPRPWYRPCRRRRCASSPPRRVPSAISVCFVLRRSHRIDMSVSGQARAPSPSAERGPRARMKRHMLSTAIRLMQDGFVPSVSDVAEAAEVSRATAYRYFPSQATMVQAVVDEALGPVLAWRSEGKDAGDRVKKLFDFAFPRMLQYEATHRAALSQALDQWARRQAGTLGNEARIVRGNRRGLLRAALAPLAGRLDSQTFDKLAQSLSLIFGIEAIVVLKDIWGIDDEAVQDVALWAAHAFVAAAVFGLACETGAAKETKKNAAAEPRKQRN